MKTVNILLFPLALTSLMITAEKIELFTTNTETFVSELEKRQGDTVEFYGYVLEQLARDCHLDDALLQQRYLNIITPSVTPTEILLILGRLSHYPHGQTCLDIARQKKYCGHSCERFIERFEGILELSKVLVESGKYRDVVFKSIPKSDLEEASIFAKERRLKKEADLDRQKTLSMLSKDIESAANNIVSVPVL